MKIQLIDINRNNFHISATEIRKNPYKNWFFIPKYVREFFVLKVAIIGSEHSGKTNLAHKLSNYYNTTDNTIDQRVYKAELQNHIENMQYSDYSNIAYEHNRRILESVKNADKLTFIDTEFSSLQTFSIIQNYQKNLVIEDLIKHSSFDILIYIEKEINSKNEKSEFDNILQHLLKKNNQKFIKLFYKNNKSLTENYIKSIEIINKYLEIN
ncbi:nicotinamide-nucleotide adenylyltransferase [Leptotrichia hongkongensis]|uniref:Nicotinamide-nucleotide adenylyltransferase n=1 Tax=Leptotrichia hongkongensis TaxID=554406 RepID=A0A510L7N9_9FUSO|nr:multifunctional transcriptional regulator/nicotinamide-nucleotide adenylyltransferase/ribosylnicotinamide kinase NadR [Leptotrichia hongkongensis]BBM60002.1 nicotinamide-nucleotide adenylyltransferase [Leptotrichia hongkongensis]